MRPEDRLSPEHLALCGALALPAFLLGDSLAAKGGLTALYILLFLLSGRRFRVLPNAVVAAGIVLAHLAAPFGMVLFRVGGFPVTQGALRLGALKAVTIIGLIYLSRLTIRAAVRLPGRAGEVLSLTLFYFERITELRPRLDLRDPWTGLDRLLREVYESSSPDSAGAVEGSSTGAAPADPAGPATGLTGPATGLAGQATGAPNGRASGPRTDAAGLALGSAFVLLHWAVYLATGK